MYQESYISHRKWGLRSFVCSFIILDILLNMLIFQYLKNELFLLGKYLLLGGLLYLIYSRWISPMVYQGLWKKVQNQLSYINFLERINRILISHLDFQQSFVNFVEELAGQVAFNRCAVYRVDEEMLHHQLYSYAVDKTAMEVEGEGMRLLAGSAIEEVVKEQMARIYRDPHWGTQDEKIWADGIRSVIQIPMFCQGKVIGVFVLSSTVSNEYQYSDLDVLGPVVERLTAAFQNCLLYQETRDLSLKDYLTDTANRRALDIRLDYEYRRAKRYQEPFSILVVDIDFFKPFNDRYGHLAGDQALRELALLMKDQVREIDLVARFGGEEFVILLPETNREQAKVVAERIRQRVEQNIFLKGTDNAQLTVCIGVATYTDDMDGVKELLQGADLKLYSAKSGGRNQVVQMN